MSVDLRSYVFLDSLQPQHSAFLGTVALSRFLLRSRRKAPRSAPSTKEDP